MKTFILSTGPSGSVKDINFSRSVDVKLKWMFGFGLVRRLGRLRYNAI